MRMHRYDREDDGDVTSYRPVFNRRASGLRRRPGRIPVP